VGRGISADRAAQCNLLEFGVEHNRPRSRTIFIGLISFSAVVFLVQSHKKNLYLCMNNETCIPRVGSLTCSPSSLTWSSPSLLPLPPRLIQIVHALQTKVKWVTNYVGSKTCLCPPWCPPNLNELIGKESTSTECKPPIGVCSPFNSLLYFAGVFSDPSREKLRIR
jgi:hypothetical protein